QPGRRVLAALFAPLNSAIVPAGRQCYTPSVTRAKDRALIFGGAMAESRPNDLPPKLKAVLIRLGKTKQLNVTQAVKLPYLVDVVATHILGRKITEGHHKAWDHGVVTREVWHYLNKCVDSPVFHLESVPLSEERRVVIDVDEPAVLSPEEQAVVDFVAHELVLRAGELGRLTKLMNPGIPSWGQRDYAASVGEDAFERLSPEYREMAEHVASLTLDQLRSSSVPVEDLEDAIA
ncbi:MAG TPA: hypothetical protein VGM86_31035, partial [Thermoanaerobaculia bacterium]